jgi:hypothetical protein
MHSFFRVATPEERERRPLMVLQAGYFDDSGSDIGSQYYVLAGFLAPVEDWKAVATNWAKTLDPDLRYFKMSEAMAFDGQFRRGWTVPLRDKLILELVDVVTAINPWRVECYLKRNLFNTFVKGILDSRTFDDPYFILFYQIVLSVVANAERIGWHRDCDFIFDGQGALEDITKSKWDWVKQNIDVNGTKMGEYLGSRPLFGNDITFRPLQAADMFAWLVRDCMTLTPPNMQDISRAALKHLEGKGKIIRLHIDRDMLMRLGASFLVGKARSTPPQCGQIGPSGQICASTQR